jgi:UDP-GlcNAc:undecaprenyl-phosphate GlcNAc-1-phosphate transferase
VAEGNVAIILAALTGACIGFLPYNFNPAKLFMGDTGSQLLGFVLATCSVMGMFKYYAVVTFIVPVLALAIPLSDTVFAFFRRLFHGQSPFKADRGHFHHKLLDMGLSQKQAVAVLYSVSAILGLAAVVLASNGVMLRIILGVAAFGIALCMWFFVFRGNRNLHPIVTDEAGNPIPEKVAELEKEEAERSAGKDEDEKD